uniref:Rabaptin coiled-coil domain-containing protein n=1 Tax=Monodelphis domestica TaxID=13616 RepID=A0A5F8H2W8_MONDO
MENMKAVAEVSESTKAEAVAEVQRQCREEVASLQTILKASLPFSHLTPFASVSSSVK